jgi:hypothetical protein
MSHWTWLFVDKLNGRCSLCDRVVGSAAPTNNANHLSAKHKISSDSPEVKAKQEERERSKSLVRIDVAIEKNRSEDMFLDFMLAYAEPYSRCEDELFRKAHPCAPASAKTLRERLLRHSARRLEEALAQLAGRWVTLAFDGGTIRSRYLAIVALSRGKPPLLVALPRCEDVMSAEWCDEQIALVAAKLAKHNISIAGYVADNAANMQKAMRLGGMLAQRCLAHSLQLAVQMAFENERTFAPVWKNAKTVLAENKLSEPCPTRWSGKFLVLRKFRVDEKVAVGMLSPSELGNVQKAEKALKIAYVATQESQRDSASMVDAVRIVAGVLAMPQTDSFHTVLRSGFFSRTPILLTDAVLLTAFFFPSIRRHALASNIRDHVNKLVRSIFERLAGETVAVEWVRFKTEAPLPADKETTFTTEQYTAWWAKNGGDRFPALVGALTKIVTMNPTEAAAERAFSSVKFAFNRLRTSAAADIVESSSVGMSAIAFLHPSHRFEDEPATPTTAIDVDAAEGEEQHVLFTPLRAERAALILDTWNTVVFETIPKERALKIHRAEGDDSRCALCKQRFEDHEDENNLRCKRCDKWFVFDCVGLSAADADYIRDRDWNCPVCREIGI